MNRPVLIIVLSLVISVSLAQSLEDSVLADTMEYSSCTDLLLKQHTPVPADLLKDRLSCIENEVPLTYNAYTKGFINYFTIRKRSYCRTMLERKDKYFPMFEQKLAEHGIPDELKYLSIIESGLNTRAQSFAGAVGLWQFIKSTAEMNGLKVNWYFDERMDPEKSTEAACVFLKDLYRQFGDWRYAIAAYNCGPGNVRKAKRHSGYSKDFWTVYKHLPRETRGYVPQFMAVMYTMKYAEEHGFAIDTMEYQMEHETIYINSYCNLDTLCSELGICTNDLITLNPAIKRNIILDSISYNLRVPKDVYLNFIKNDSMFLAKANIKGEEELNYKPKNYPGNTDGKMKLVYKVKTGDFLGKIASSYGVSVTDLKRWNRLRGNMIHPGQRINIWRRPEYFAEKAKNEMRQKEMAKAKIKLIKPTEELYTVQPGDTLWDIAKLYEGVTIQKLKKLNKLGDKPVLKPGQKLKLI